MGLDWVTQTKAIPGKESEFTKLLHELIARTDLSQIDFSKDSSEWDIFNLDIVLSAVRYCRYWGERGFYIVPWY